MDFYSNQDTSVLLARCQQYKHLTNLIDVTS